MYDSDTNRRYDRNDGGRTEYREDDYRRGQHSQPEDHYRQEGGYGDRYHGDNGYDGGGFRSDNPYEDERRRVDNDYADNSSYGREPERMDYRDGRYRDDRYRDDRYRRTYREDPYRNDSYRNLRRDFNDYEESRDRGYDYAPRRESAGEPRDDAFEKQMDSFRDKTRQLQELIDDKQERVDYLEKTLAELTDKNQQLEDELLRSRQETGDYAADIEDQVNRLSEILDKDFDDLGQRISDQLARLPEQLPGEMQEITFDTEALTSSIDGQAKRMEDIFTAISDKLEQIIEKQSESATQSFDEVFSDQKSFLSNSMLTQEKKLSESLNGVSRQMDGMKDELSEKIHSEDVKIYRNLQDFIQSQDHSEEDEKKTVKRFNKLRGWWIITLVLTIIDVGLGVAFLMIIM